MFTCQKGLSELELFKPSNLWVRENNWRRWRKWSMISCSSIESWNIIFMWKACSTGFGKTIVVELWHLQNGRKQIQVSWLIESLINHPNEILRLGPNTIFYNQEKGCRNLVAEYLKVSEWRFTNFHHEKRKLNLSFKSMKTPRSFEIHWTFQWHV